MKDPVYPSISDYGFIADCHSAALVSSSGSIDWCCMPRFDSSSCFGRILDWNRAGYCVITPVQPSEVARRYLPRTLVLETTFRTPEGEARLLDCFTMRRGGQQQPHQQLLRVVEGIRGHLDVAVEIVPRFDYGAIEPWIRRVDQHHVAVGGSDGLIISGDLPLERKGRHQLAGRITVRPGERLRLSLAYAKPEALDGRGPGAPEAEVLDRRLQETIDWWRRWSRQGKTLRRYGEQALRSAIVLKGLTNAPTGAIVAAATTSLPEAPQGARNWDYRFSWIRDSAFAVRSLGQLGFDAEAGGFRRFVERAAAGSADQVQILFGLGGERRVVEQELSFLDGYRGARPVRVGNAAVGQTQLDVYGELLDLTVRWHDRGHTPDDDYWQFLVELVNKAASGWAEPDRGFWELRGQPRHFVHSKAMCWAALDNGVRLAEELGREGPVRKWREARDEVRRTVERRGYDPERGTFVQAFEHPRMDAALLLLPLAGFVDYRDERMLRTTDAIVDELAQDGLLRRYAAGDDEMEGEEGVFLAGSFWLAECMARQRRLDAAHEVFQRALSTANDLGLFAEEFDTRRGEPLGNFPQALTHLSLIAAAVALDQVAAATR